MTDILIRDVPDDILSAIDGKAKRLGLTRAAYLRRALEREGVASPQPVTREGLERLAALTADLDDPEVMSEAWS
ncbi:MAG TPA: antitoxin [Ilumatobacter sp.]|nr:antitoxin [Ilumatobacter sp.]